MEKPITLEQAAASWGVTRRRLFQLLDEHGVKRERVKAEGRSLVFIDRDDLQRMRPAREVQFAAEAAASVRERLATMPEAGEGERFVAEISSLMIDLGDAAREQYAALAEPHERERVAAATRVAEMLGALQSVAWTGAQIEISDEEFAAAYEYGCRVLHDALTDCLITRERTTGADAQ